MSFHSPLLFWLILKFIFNFTTKKGINEQAKIINITDELQEDEIQER